MSNVDDDPEDQLDPEDYDDDTDLVIDETLIRLPFNSPYRLATSMAKESVHRLQYELDGMCDELPEFLNFKDPLDDLDW